LATLDDFVTIALTQRGDPYEFGAEATFGDRNPPEFDCSELVQWAAVRCEVTFVDGAQNQRDACLRAGTIIEVKQGVRTRGALLFRIDPGPGNDHVAISLGNGKTIEARGESFGVNEFRAAGRRWTHAGVIPGFQEEDDMTKDELLAALESPRGQKILTKAVTKAVNQEVTRVLRAAFAGHAPKPVDPETIRASQDWLFKTVAGIKTKVDRP